MRPHLLLLFAFAFGALLSCKHDKDLQPQCYAGTVLGSSCYDGLIINVDAQFPIGKPVGAGFAPKDSTKVTYQNVIGALNSTELARFNTPGQRIYFTCTGDTQGFSNFGPCNHMGIPLPVPHVVLTSFSATPCGPVAP
ncbi:hypothetical protein [Hymenobacter nivis]|uniref:Lipoprotein n=1 Tax=Hymenobacter nivis TaxID=1850093 RepID=A0A2Z3GKW3_9BACT|nr:hypothetical protein [Hymenobacter nivis]AWM34463.1 hypothetical protein DDQ68_17735 [Hymenobacter nivis]